MLEGMNFKVFSLVNLRFMEMMKALEVFYEMLAVPGVYALFYYSGHGFSHLNTNYLMPVDAIIPLECDHNIVSDQIGARMQNTLSRAIKILDCCTIKQVLNLVPRSSSWLLLLQARIADQGEKTWEQGYIIIIAIHLFQTADISTSQP